MSVHNCKIEGKAQLPPANLPHINPGQGASNTPHSFMDLTECSCPYLDRFSAHGSQIRAAYENAVVNAIGIINKEPVNVAVVGSGGLLQEAVWLTKLYQKHKPFHLALHLIDLDYTIDDSRINSLATYAKEIVPRGTTLDIYAWDSCEALKAAAQKTHGLIFDLVIGMDIEQATDDAKEYQWKLLVQGDIEKTLLVKWTFHPAQGLLFEIYGRRGSDNQLMLKVYPKNEVEKAAVCIKNAAFVGL